MKLLLLEADKPYRLMFVFSELHPTDAMRQLASNPLIPDPKAWRLATVYSLTGGDPNAIDEDLPYITI